MKKNASNQFHLPRICSYFPEYHAGNRNGPAKRNQSTGKESVYRKGISSEERNPSSRKESVRRKGIRPAERNQSSGKDSALQTAWLPPSPHHRQSVQRKGISLPEMNQSGGKESIQRKGISPAERW